MLQIKISKAEIQKLNYERYKYPCPLVQKRMHAVHLKATNSMNNEMIGKIVDLHRDSVGYWIMVYKLKVQRRFRKISDLKIPVF